ncbi:hypothetical protein PYCCODRAFT_924749 [Trametes coccinea BRFM310]|uniref:Uncharacterized protein n=1 Tax=Trametes coccinea (strain BRFM310) TaxID=1353009 RepID=A0A1Y2IZ06_TRAC3|nr:hypothetical protein PYCCODRAFT_924749 [Trametes coccinea BRFM310]
MLQNPATTPATLEVASTGSTRPETMSSTHPRCVGVSRGRLGHLPALGTRGGASPHNRTGPRCASAPPGLHRQPLGVLQETDERNEAGVEILRPGAPPPPAIRGHSPSDCANDPLCATHRKRPLRDRHPVSRPEHLANPHKRRPLALKERRPQSGNGTCDDLDCMSRSCADCAYLRSRGGVLHTKIARRGVEDKLISLDFTSRYAEDTLALLRFRAVRQVRRTML